MKTLQINDDFEITTSELAKEMGIKHKSLFELKQGTYDTPKGETRTYLKPMVTAKGELFIQRLFMKNTQKLIGEKQI